MSFDAGAVVGKMILDSGQWTKGMGSVTGSMFKAQVAFQAFNQVLRMVTGVLGDSVKAFAQQQQAEAQMAAVLKSTGYAAGVTAKELTDMAGALQKVTTYGDETIMGAQNILLTFTKIGKDIFPQATTTVLDMATALGQDLKSTSIQVGKALQDPILGVTALRRVGVNFNKAQSEVIKNLVETGRSAEAQAMILKELQTEFGGSAEAAGKTFAGSLAILNNQIGESQESLGMYMSAAAKPFVDQIAKIVDGLNEWLASAEGIATMTNIFSTLAGVGAVVWTILQKIGEIWTEWVDNIMTPLAEAWSSLVGEGAEAAAVFSILGKILDVLGFVLGVVSKTIGVVITWLGGLVKVIIATADAAYKLYQALNDVTNPAKWQAVADAGTKIGDAWQEATLKNEAASRELARYTAEKFTEIVMSGDNTAKELETSFSSAADAVKSNLEGMATDVATRAGEMGDEITENAAGTSAEKVRQTWGQVFDELQEKLEETTEKFGFGSQQWQFAFQDFVEHVEDGMNQIFDTISMVWSSISGVIGQAITNQIAELDKKYEQDKARIENSVMDEEEKKLQLEILEKEYEEKKRKKQREAFELERAGNILSAIMNTAGAVTSALKVFPPWLGISLAAVVGAMGAVQTGLIASQVNPYAMGGIASGWSLVGEQGPELVNFGSPSRVLPNDETSAIMGGMSGQTVNFNGPIYRETDVDRMLMMAGSRFRKLRKGA